MQNKKRRQKRWPVLFAALAVAAAFYIFISIRVSSDFLVVRSFEADLGTGAEIRAVVISDLHDHTFGDGNRKLAEKIREQDPDLILMDGDMLNSNSADASVPLKLIGQLKDTASIYYALGNHELAYMEGGRENLTEELEAAGATVLDKEYVDIEINGVQIRLGGMYDYAFGINGNNEALAAPEDTLVFLRDFQDTELAKIMLAHRPDSFIFGDASQVWNVDLVISGHNHGGQVVLPFLGGVFGGDQGWFPEYVHGMYEKDGVQIFETAGLGSNRQKIPRLNNPPEIAVLTIS